MGGPSLVDLPLPFVLAVPIRGPGRYLHFLAAWVIVFTGLVYVAAGLAARHFGRNLLPSRDEASTPAAIGSVIRKHLRFERSSDAELATYNALQRASYTTVVFVLSPLMIWTGLAMSPAAVFVFPFLAEALGGQQTARTAPFRRGVRPRPVPRRPCRARLPDGVQEPDAGHDHGTRPGRAQDGLRRRTLPAHGAQGQPRRPGGSGRVGSRGAAGEPLRPRPREPPRPLRPERNRHLRGAAPSHEASLDGARIRPEPDLEGDSGEREGAEDRALSGPRGGGLRGLEAHDRRHGGSRPASFWLAELEGLSSRSHITHQACEEGWSFIAEWTGVPLSLVLEAGGGSHPGARYVFFFAFDEWWDSIDMDDALHPQTLAGLRHERPGAALGPWRAAAAPSVPRQLRVQEPQVPLADHGDR